MDLDQYFTRPGAESMATFAQERSMNEGQIRQWRHQYKGRRPATIACVVLERSTNGALRRWDLRPDDWHEHWPELIGAEGAPPVPHEQAA
jgi:DNA-binding transcriptional regulator YdaS (Cro superfamily)